MSPKLRSEKIIALFREKQEVFLVWILLLVVVILGIYLLYGYIKKPSPSALVSLRMGKPLPVDLKEVERATKEWIAQFEKDQRPLPYYQERLKNNIFASLIQKGKPVKRIVKKAVAPELTLRGVIGIKGSPPKALLEDNEGGGYLIGEGQTLKMGKGKARRDVKALRIGSKSVVLLVKGQRKPITLKLPEELPKASGKLVVLPSATSRGDEPARHLSRQIGTITGGEGTVTEEEEEELEYEERRLRERRKD